MHLSYEFREVIAELIFAEPKMIGLSLHTTNLSFCKEIVKQVKSVLPETLIVVGGYDCMRPDQGRYLFPEYDYMVVFEAENTLGSLVEQLVKGERPKNIPGILSKYDNDAFPFIRAPLVDDLDNIDFPTYEWRDINLYRNWNGYQLTPIVLTRGCRWSICTFCAERFPWRIRSASNLVDEIEWLASKGCTIFHFNDSDLSGDPAVVREVCEEIIRRDLQGLSFVGQLRVQKRYSQE